MRLDRPLDGLLFSRTATRLLRVLAKFPTKLFTGRELAEAAGAPPHRTMQVLRRLEGEGLVVSRVVGRAYEWRVRAAHPLLPALRKFFDAEDAARAQFLQLVNQTLRKVAGVQVVLFGSAARREEGPHSDLDLLVITASRAAQKELERPLEALRESALEGFGTRVRPMLLTRAEFARRRSSSFIQSIEREGLRLEFGDDNVRIEQLEAPP